MNSPPCFICEFPPLVQVVKFPAFSARCEFLALGACNMFSRSWSLLYVCYEIQKLEVGLGTT